MPRRYPAEVRRQVVDMAIQLHGGAGLSNDLPLAGAWTAARSLRLADGPDEVHRGVIARLELARYGKGKWSS
jgi:acyl-CoA dehydrogenase